MISRPHLPPLSKCENQIVSFYGFPLKSGTLDPPSAVILLHALVYFWKPPTLLSLFKTPAQVCLLFTLPVGTNSKVRWLSICMRSCTTQEKPQGTFGGRSVGPQLLVLMCGGVWRRINYQHLAKSTTGTVSTSGICLKLLNVKNDFSLVMLR